MKTMADLIAEYEAELLAKGRAEIAAEDAAWQALTPEQQAAHFAAVSLNGGDNLGLAGRHALGFGL